MKNIMNKVRLHTYCQWLDGSGEIDLLYCEIWKWGIDIGLFGLGCELTTIDAIPRNGFFVNIWTWGADAGKGK